MSTDIRINVTEIQRYCMHDGPGIRTTVFFKGCPLRCEWCHNPETQKRESELLFYESKCIFCKSCETACVRGAHIIKDRHAVDRTACIGCFSCTQNCPSGALEVCGRELSVDEILSVVKKDLAFYGEKGGITISGGEPFLQKEAAIALLEACRADGISTAAETCGWADPDVLEAAVPLVDLFLWDLKDTDEDRHKRFTGVSNGKILQNLSMVSKMGARIRLRCILVRGVNTEKSHYEAIAGIAAQIPVLDGVELIPYHAYGGTKATFLGGEDNGRREFIPDAAELAYAREIITARKITVI